MSPEGMEKAMGELVQIDFHGDALWATRRDGEVYVAVKPICDALGVDWEGQRQRIRRDTVLLQEACVIQTWCNGGFDEMTCLPLGLVNGWLFGIDDSRLADAAARDKVIAYKRECHEVLFRHFYGQAVGAGAGPAPLPDREDLRIYVDLVRVCRSVFDRSAAQRLWKRLPLPVVDDGAAGASAPEPAALFDGAACLAHLVAWAPVADGRTVGELVESQDPGDRAVLSAIGVRVDPPGWSGHVAVMNAADGLEDAFADTPWSAGGWRRALLTLPNARSAGPFRMEGGIRRAVVLPKGLLINGGSP